MDLQAPTKIRGGTIPRSDKRRIPERGALLRQFRRIERSNASRSDVIELQVRFPFTILSLMQRETVLVVALCLMTITLSLVGCSSKPAKPTQAEIEKVFSEFVSAESNTRLKVAHVTQLREEQKVMGNVRWALEAELECAEEGVWLSSGSREGVTELEVTGPGAEEIKQKLQQYRRQPNDFRTDANGMVAKDAGLSIKAGEKFRVVGVFSLSQENKKWLPEGFTMRRFPEKIQ